MEAEYLFLLANAVYPKKDSFKMLIFVFSVELLIVTVLYSQSCWGSPYWLCWEKL